MDIFDIGFEGDNCIKVRLVSDREKKENNLCIYDDHVGFRIQHEGDELNFILGMHQCKEFIKKINFCIDLAKAANGSK